VAEDIRRIREFRIATNSDAEGPPTLFCHAKIYNKEYTSDCASLKCVESDSRARLLGKRGVLY